ncbi:MAG: SDR family oxidoreductase [Cyanobacteria bacterium J06642_11]
MATIQRILITGATGGVGQLAVAYALAQGYAVRALTRNINRARSLFDDRVELIEADLRALSSLPAALADIDAVICSSGTTAFPSDKWQVELPAQPWEQVLVWGRVLLDQNYRQIQAKNSPAIADGQGVTNLINTAQNFSVQRFILVSSLGVERRQQIPFSILNTYGVLDAKAKAEDVLHRSGLDYTVVRPGRLIDGPYTSYDLNTLIKASTDGKQAIIVGVGDTLLGQTSRKDVAAACVECLQASTTSRKTFEIINQGTRPAVIPWSSLFASLS